MISRTPSTESPDSGSANKSRCPRVLLGRAIRTGCGCSPHRSILFQCASAKRKSRSSPSRQVGCWAIAMMTAQPDSSADEDSQSIQKRCLLVEVRDGAGFRSGDSMPKYSVHGLQTIKPYRKPGVIRLFAQGRTLTPGQSALMFQRVGSRGSPVHPILQIPSCSGLQRHPHPNLVRSMPVTVETKFHSLPCGLLPVDRRVTMASRRSFVCISTGHVLEVLVLPLPSFDIIGKSMGRTLPCSLPCEQHQRLKLHGIGTL